jgi:hypothetical protein
MGAPPVTPSKPHASGVGILCMDAAGSSLPWERLEFQSSPGQHLLNVR